MTKIAPPAFDEVVTVAYLCLACHHNLNRGTASLAVSPPIRLGAALMKINLVVALRSRNPGHPARVGIVSIRASHLWALSQGAGPFSI